jgi:hypothetical protein
MISPGKGQLFEIVSMLTGLQNSLLARIGEVAPGYRTARE